MAVSYPGQGCICEYLEANAPQIAIVMEENNGKLRLLLPGRKETKIAANRLLPWLGPVYPSLSSKEEMLRLLEQHKKAREVKAPTVQLMELWEMAQGEVQHARAEWFAELVEAAPDADAIAAYGRALLGCKTHFRFQPPEFQVYDEATVSRRMDEQKSRQEKEALASQGSAFLRLLWDTASQKRELPLSERVISPSDDLGGRIRKMLMARVANPESMEDEALWRLLSKGLPDAPHLPLQLLVAWGELPRHYNFWLDRADYASGDDWWQDCADEVEELVGAAPPLPACELPFISIDGESTLDIDDAFHIEKAGEITVLTLAFACPAISWPFGGCLDKIVSRRATSIYLPEGDLHMLPEKLGTDSYSLRALQERPALCLRLELDAAGAILKSEPFLAQVKLAANLRYGDVQNILDAGHALPDNPASPFADQLLLAHGFAQTREKWRISNGAIVMLREEPKLKLSEEGDKTLVELELAPLLRDAQRLVSEIMILASASFADWAFDHAIPLLHRTQNVALPKEYAGIWENPEDLARIMRALIPSSLEVEPRPHAALGLQRYAQATSPLRRYPDLINEAQLASYLQTGKPRLDRAKLSELLDAISPCLDAAGMTQKARPRYWKLLYLRQQGDKKWHNGVITEDNENFVNVALPEVNLFVRGRRNLFDERAAPGMRVRLRLGKVNPLANDMQIMEVIADE